MDDLKQLFNQLKGRDFKLYTVDDVYHAELKSGHTTYANYDLETILLKLINEL